MNRVTTDLYELLEVAPTASADEIKHAYRRHAIRYHPDRNKTEGATAQFQQLTKAYETLSDPNQRQLYDQQRQPKIKPAQWNKINPETPPNKATKHSRVSPEAANPAPKKNSAETERPKPTAAKPNKPSFFRARWGKNKPASAAQDYEQRVQQEQQAQQQAAEALARQQAAAAVEAKRAAAAAQQQIEQERCQHCLAQGRLLTRRHIYTNRGCGWTNKSRVIKGNFCPSCLHKLLWQANLITLLLGWWAWPKGPYYSLKALWANWWRDPQRQREQNALLTYQFLRRKLRDGQQQAALQLAYRAHLLSQEPAFKQQMRDLISRQTRLSATGLTLHLLIHKVQRSLLTPLGLVALLVVVIAAGQYWSDFHFSDFYSKPHIAQQYQGENYVLSEQLSLHLAPNATSPALELLVRYDPLMSPNARVIQGFLEVQLSNGRRAYAELSQVGLGSATRARILNCNQAQQDLASGSVLQRQGLGANTLVLANPYESELVIRLAGERGNHYEMLIHPAKTQRLTQIADDRYRVEIEQGRFFNASCHSFMKPIAIHQLPTQLELIAKTMNGYAMPAQQELKLPRVW